MSFQESSPKPSKPTKLLIITSSGGGGLLQAAVAKEQEAKANDPTVQIVKRDVLKDWVWKRLGRFSIFYWNGAQRRGLVKAQLFIVQFQWLFELFSWPAFFYKTLKILYKENIDRVIDTQVMGTSAILKAIRLFNRKMGKNVVLEKIVVDLPTKKATHCFRPIKNLSRKDKKILKLTTIAPLLEEGQSAEEFWQENCGLSEGEIYYEGLTVRQNFRKLTGKKRSPHSISLPIRFKNQEELQLMNQCLERGSIRNQVKGKEIHLTIHPEDRVFTILLGSQPANEATLTYVKKFISLAKEAEELKIPSHLFVFCSDMSDKDSLFGKVVDLVVNAKSYPKYFSVIPFSFQTDDVIAPLFHRSDLTCTRSGGQTAMELMAVSTGEIWIHSEAKRKENEMTLEDLLGGIPAWEGASALYLKKFRGAKIVTPETFIPYARRHFQASPIRALESTA